MKLLFRPDDSGTDRGTGYATVDYSSSSEDETAVETTEDELSTIFETSIDAAVDDPLAFSDFLILDDSGSIVFDSDYVRETPDGTTSS